MMSNPVQRSININYTVLALYAGRDFSFWPQDNNKVMLGPLTPVVVPSVDTNLEREARQWLGW